MRRRCLLYNATIDYSQMYLTFMMAGEGTVSFHLPKDANVTSISYSIDDGSTWTTTNRGSSDIVVTSPRLVEGETVLWKGSGESVGSSGSSHAYFTTTAQCILCGNIQSVLYGDSFKTASSVRSVRSLFSDVDNGNGFTMVVDASNLILPNLTMANNCYGTLFKGCTTLVTPPRLQATTLTIGCYQGMFFNCTALTTAPDLVATNVQNSCYRDMFHGCTSLTTVPFTLKATTLSPYCYYGMFHGCTSLTTAPSMSATTLASYCCYNMFRGCSNLTTAPELYAETLVGNCYSYMFYGCGKLNYIKALFKTTPSSTYTYYWVYGVASSGTFMKHSMATWNVRGVSGIPTNWSITYPYEYLVLDVSNDNFASDAEFKEWLEGESPSADTFHLVYEGGINGYSYYSDNIRSFIDYNGNVDVLIYEKVDDPTDETYVLIKKSDLISALGNWGALINVNVGYSEDFYKVGYEDMDDTYESGSGKYALWSSYDRDPGTLLLKDIIDVRL